MLPLAIMDEERLLVDVELWTLIVELAAVGPRGLEGTLRDISLRWANTASCNDTRRDRSPLPTREAWQEQLASNRHLEKAFRKRSIVSDRLRWYQRWAGGCISPDM